MLSMRLNFKQDLMNSRASIFENFKFRVRELRESNIIKGFFVIAIICYQY